MNIQEDEATAQETAGCLLPGSSFEINPLAIPLRESYRNSVNALMDYFDTHGILYIPRCEDLGVCLTLRSDIPRWEATTQIRLGTCTGIVAINTWMEQFQLDSFSAWKTKRLIEAVNSHCEFAELGYNTAMRRVYARTQVWFADTDLRPRDVELAMRATGALLLRALLELFEITANRKRIEDSIDAILRWLKEQQMQAVVDVPEVEIETASKATV